MPAKMKLEETHYDRKIGMVVSNFLKEKELRLLCWANCLKGEDLNVPPFDFDERILFLKFDIRIFKCLVTKMENYVYLKGGVILDSRKTTLATMLRLDLLLISKAKCYLYKSSRPRFFNLLGRGSCFVQLKQGIDEAEHISR
ncbi:hypothetical protein Csa_013188, partial [Cucumis sativus]